MSTLCNPMDCSPPGSSVHGILQARILEWIAVPFSRGSSQPRDQTQVSHIVGGFFKVWVTLNIGEYWRGSPIPSPGDHPTRESNRGLLHGRRILYQLSYQGSPDRGETGGKARSTTREVRWKPGEPRIIEARRVSIGGDGEQDQAPLQK